MDDPTLTTERQPRRLILLWKFEEIEGGVPVGPAVLCSRVPDKRRPTLIERFEWMSEREARQLAVKHGAEFLFG